MAKVKKIYVESELIFKEKSSDPRFFDLDGMKFEMLTVLGYAGNSKWYYKCDCGSISITQGRYLREGKSKSCGCYSQGMIGERSKTHGRSRIKKGAYSVWMNMIARCTNINSATYKNYGGRGIKVCNRWLKFENFLEDMGDRPKGLTLDRIDNDKGYFKENCRWATIVEQANNKRTNVFVEFMGERKTIKQWSDTLGIGYHTLKVRIKKWTVERALTTPIKNKK